MAQLDIQASAQAQTTVTMTLALAMALATLGTSIANIALPALTETFSAPFVQAQAVVVAYLAALTISTLVAGWLGDRYGLKSALVLGLSIFTAASVMCAVAPNLWLLVCARVLQGIGAAFMMVLAMALMRQMASEARIGRAMGLLGTVSALGTALGPVVGGVLIPVGGWRSIFWVQVPLALLAIALAVTRLPADRDAGRLKSASPWSMMNWSLGGSLFVNLVVACVMMATLVVGPFYLSLGLGLRTELVGLVMAIGPAISIAGGVPSGRLVDSWGSRRVLVIGLVLLMAGAGMLALSPQMMSVAGYILAIAVLTPGYQLFQAANNTAMLTDVPEGQRGTISGLLGLSRNIGLVVGASCLGAVFAYAVGANDTAQAEPAAIGRAMAVTFLLASGVMATATVLTLERRTRF